MVNVSWFPTGFGIGLFISLTIFLANRNKHGPGTVMGEILGIVAVFTLITTVSNVQAILASYGVKIDLLYGIIAGLFTGFGMALLSLISRGVSAVGRGIGIGGVGGTGIGSGGVRGATTSTRKFMDKVMDVSKRSNEVRNIIHRLASELEGIEKVSEEEIRKIDIEVVKVLFNRLENFLNNVEKTLSPYFYYSRFRWMNTAYLLLVEKKVLSGVMGLKNEAIGVLRLIEKSYEDIINSFKRTLDSLLNVDKNLIEVSDRLDKIVNDLEKDLENIYGLLDGIKKFEESFAKFDEKELVLDNEVESLLAKYGANIRSLKEIERDVIGLIRSCREVSTRINKIEIADRGVVNRIKEFRRNTLSVVREKKIYSALEGQFEELAKTENVKKIIDGRIVEIENTRDPANLLYTFGKGVNFSLETLTKEMDKFVRGLKKEEAGIEVMFKAIYEEMKAIEEEIKSTCEISESLEGIVHSLGQEQSEIKAVEDCLREAEEYMAKMRNSLDESKAEEKEKAIIMKALKILERQREALEVTQKELDILKNDINKVVKLSENIQEPFEIIKNELSNTKGKIIELLEKLRKDVETHRDSLNLLRNRVLYRIKEICSTLLRIEKDVKESKRVGEVARAS